MKPTEAEIVHSVIAYLQIQGHYVWRNNTGMFRHNYTTKAGINKQSIIRAGMKGSADILGIAKDGKFIAVECKVPGNKPTILQEEFLREIRERGGYAIVATSIDDVIKHNL